MKNKQKFFRVKYLLAYPSLFHTQIIKIIYHFYFLKTHMFYIQTSHTEYWYM